MPLLAPGQRAWAHEATVLPKGLGEGSLLEVVAPVPGCWSWHVREVATDRVFEMNRVNIDNGYEFEMSPGRWVPEHHPKILDHLERRYREQVAEAESMPDLERRSLCLRVAGFYQRVLVRNGRVVSL